MHSCIDSTHVREMSGGGRDLFNLHTYVSQKKRLRDYMEEEGMIREGREEENERLALPAEGQVLEARTGPWFNPWDWARGRNNNNPANAAAAARPPRGAAAAVADVVNNVARAIGLGDNDIVAAAT